MLLRYGSYQSIQFSFISKQYAYAYSVQIYEFYEHLHNICPEKCAKLFKMLKLYCFAMRLMNGKVKTEIGKLFWGTQIPRRGRFGRGR